LQTKSTKILNYKMYQKAEDEVIAFLISLRYNYDNSKGAVDYEWQ